MFYNLEGQNTLKEPFRILSADHGTKPNSLLALKAREEDSGRYACKTPGKQLLEGRYAKCYDVIVKARGKSMEFVRGDDEFPKEWTLNANGNYEMLDHDNGSRIMSYLTEKNQRIVLDCKASVKIVAIAKETSPLVALQS